MNVLEAIVLDSYDKKEIKKEEVIKQLKMIWNSVLNKIKYDDETIRLVVYKDDVILDVNECTENGISSFNIEFNQKINKVECQRNLICKNIIENVHSHGNVYCENIGQTVVSQGDVISTNIYGNVVGNKEIRCKDIIGNVTTEDKVYANDICGTVNANIVNCEDVHGNLDITGEVYCKNIIGDVYVDGKILSEKNLEE